MNKLNEKNKGFTLVELIVCIVLVVTILTAMFGVLITSVKGIMRAQEIKIATFHLQNVMERIQSVGFSNLTTYFPNNDVVDQAIVGGYVLEGEQVRVSYPQGTGNNPLEVKVEITWTDINGDASDIEFETIRTNMI